jgi:hypothetical protein
MVLEQRETALDSSTHISQVLSILTYLLTYSMEQSPTWEANSLQLVKKFPAIFMEPKGLSPHSQAHVTCPYPESAQSSPHTHIPLPGDLS